MKSKHKENNKTVAAIFLKNILKWLDKNQMTVGILLLAIVTTWVSYDAKIFADLSFEQFKIKSHPTFEVDTPNIHVDAERLTQEFVIYNKGETAAFNVTFLFVLVFETENGTGEQFHIADSAVYRNEEKPLGTLNFEQKIISNGWKDLNYTKILSGLDKYGGMDKLRKGLLIVKFQAQHDDTFSYEEFAYALKTEKKNDKETENMKYSWQVVNARKTRMLCRNFIEALSNTKQGLQDRIKYYFNDYKYLTEVNGHA